MTARRLVVKVGTSTLTGGGGRLDRGFIESLVEQISRQCAEGRQVLLVSSGAIRAGLEHLGKGAGSAAGALPYKQAAAAVGQGLLLHTYAESFARRGLSVGQVLLTRDDLGDRRRFLNARNTLCQLLRLGVVPVINENDTVAVEEIQFGDNDTLAARVAVLAEADLLIILSDVEGLYDTRLPVVARVDAEIEALAGGSGTQVGTGGMRTKVEAARIAAASGVRTVIARGRRPDVIAQVVHRAGIGTTFLPRKTRVRGRKRWIAAGTRSRGAVLVNEGAAASIRRDGRSLLAVGVVGVVGEFDAGDLVDVRGPDGRRFARGLANYCAADIRRIQGLRSDQFERALGSRPYDEVVHRDNLFVE